MVKLAISRKSATTTALIPFAVSIALLGACKPNQPPSNAPGTAPSVWTGSPAPSNAQPKGGPGAPEGLTAHLKMPDGTDVATVKFEFESGAPHSYVTVTVQTTGLGRLSPGFHGLHIHSVGKCEANSIAPAGGAPGDFLSAGGHYQAPGHTGAPESGDLTSLQVRKDGAALLVTTTDAFTKEDLLGGQGTAIIIHADSDNFANIPPGRYTQVNGAPGPDKTTMSTGDAGKRAACGVIRAG
jgi:superoxide dismutase, Cu-Zn family